MILSGIGEKIIQIGPLITEISSFMVNFGMSSKNFMLTQILDLVHIYNTKSNGNGNPKKLIRYSIPLLPKKNNGVINGVTNEITPLSRYYRGKYTAAK